jgi:hypothetical protein
MQSIYNLNDPRSTEVKEKRTQQRLPASVALLKRKKNEI